ncbi:glucosaminidase domain-containing protein [Paenibacillus humicola]|uniref:glucosaminidase domain-containing protein n=1 Tax=Paenibacillus humicola TaxID=3110540 RepID=UPI00237A9A4C|nr:glucosaminidase domain-containing protein [Paenibacillus humicola]
MRSQIRRFSFSVILCVTLLLIIEPRFASPKPAQADAETAVSLPAGAAITPLLDIKPAVFNLHKQAYKAAAAKTTVPVKPAPAKPASEVKTAAASVKPAVYETTAYYLNIRANPYVGSKILKTVSRGTRLIAVGATKDGWLRLDGEGYVNRDYTKPVGEAAVQALAAAEKPALQTLALAAKEKTDPIPRPAVQTKTAAHAESGPPTKPTSLIKSKSGLTEEQIAAFFKGTALSGHGLEKAVLDTEREFGINALFTIAVMKLESGNGKSRLAKKKNNLFGLNAVSGSEYVKALSFRTKGDSVRKFGQLIAKNYVNKGYTTIEKVARKYCPANSRWPSYVKNIMRRDYKKL